MVVTKIDGHRQVIADTITNAEINAAAAIATSKLAEGADFIQRDGSVVFTADQSHGGFKITNLGAPVDANDAVRKQDLDAVSAGLDPKASVRVATTTAGILATDFENLDVVDGVTLATGNRILIKNQAAGAENGIYTVNATGAPTRATDADSSTEVTPGMFCFVEEGTANADSGWVLVTDAPITLGTTALTFTQFTGAGQIIAGNGLTKTANTIDAVGTANRIVVSADAIDIGSDVLTIDRYIIRETPSGAINGTNVTFTLANTPVTGTETVYLNGLLQEPGAGNDYTISGTTITYLSAPLTGDRLKVNYIKTA